MDNPSENQYPPDIKAAREFTQRLYANCPRSIVVPTIVAINLIIFVIMLTQGAGFTGQNLEIYIEHGANLGALTKTDQWWRLFTAMFLHYGVLHLAFNMWVLWDSGKLVERLYGHFNFAWIYLSTGLFASLSSLYWNMDDVASVGASGAVFGVFGALIGFLLNQKQSIPVLLQKHLMKSALIFTGFSLVMGFTIPAIDNAAHIGGLVSGIIMGLLLAKPIDRKKPALVSALAAHAGSVALIILLIALSSPPRYDYYAQESVKQQISDFITEEKQLVEEWREIVESMRTGEGMDKAILTSKLYAARNRWSSIRIDTSQRDRLSGKVQQRLDLLNEYTDHRILNIDYLLRYINSGEEQEVDNFSKNMEKIRQLIKELNSLNQ